MSDNDALQEARGRLLNARIRLIEILSEKTAIQTAIEQAMLDVAYVQYGFVQGDHLVSISKLHPTKSTFIFDAYYVNGGETWASVRRALPSGEPAHRGKMLAPLDQLRKATQDAEVEA